ncbi:MAG: hypothetical protein HUU25_07805 [Candidatus Sumerlaeia bacterium]|nr:hypothetical protein [Candidatus Sumerlaeia bacterium]
MGEFGTEEFFQPPAIRLEDVSDATIAELIRWGRRVIGGTPEMAQKDVGSYIVGLWARDAQDLASSLSARTGKTFARVEQHLLGSISPEVRRATWPLESFDSLGSPLNFQRDLIPQLDPIGDVVTERLKMLIATAELPGNVTENTKEVPK